MKTRTFIILLLVFFGLCLVFSRISLGNAWPGRVDVTYAVSLTMLAAGALIASASAFILFQRGLSGQAVEQSLPMILALLGGLLLYQLNWGVALALAIIVTAALLVRHLVASKGPPED